MAAKLSKKQAVDLVKRKSQNLGKLRKPNWFSVLMTLMLAMFIYLQVILWIGDGSLADVWRLKKSIAELKAQNKELLERNQKLINEVEALRSGNDLIEDHAREDLGMVKKDEIFYHVIEDKNTKNNNDK